MEARVEHIRSVCIANGIDHVLLSDRISVEEAVFGALRDQGLIRGTA